MEDDTSNNQQKRQRAESGSDEDDVFNKSDNKACSSPMMKE